MQRVEPFLDLSLPINIETEEPRIANVTQIPSKIILKVSQKKTSKKKSSKSKSDANIDKNECAKSQKEEFYASDNDEEEPLSKHQTKKQIKLAQKKAKVNLAYHLMKILFNIYDLNSKRKVRNCQRNMA